MKGWVKGMLITSAVFVGVGTVVCGAAWAMGGRFSHYRSKRFGFVVEDRIVADTPVEVEVQEEAVWEEDVSQGSGDIHRDREHHNEATYVESEILSQTELSPGGQLFIDGRYIRELEINVTGAYVEVVPDEDVDEPVVVVDNDGYRCDQILDEDTLKINVSKRGRTDPLSQFDGDGEIGVEIKLPMGCQFEDVELDVKGGLLLAQGIVADSLDLELSAGGLEVMDGSVGELNGDCKAGELVYIGSVGRKMEADCSAGSMEYVLEGKEEDFHYEMEKQMGSIVIDGIEREFNGKTVVSNPGAVKMAELECKVGEISVSFSGS